jgi:acetyl-CoA carboxylase carboxyl transferase subunit alpha
MGVTSDNLQNLGIVDETIPEPMGGAHRDIEAMSSTIKEHLSTQLDELQDIPVDDLLERRYQRLMSYGSPD